MEIAEAQKKLTEINLPPRSEIIETGGNLYEVSERIKRGEIKEDDGKFLSEAHNLFSDLGLQRLYQQIATSSPKGEGSPTEIREIAEQAEIEFNQGAKTPDALKRFVATLMYAEPGYACKIAIDAMIAISERNIQNSYRLL